MGYVAGLATDSVGSGIDNPVGLDCYWCAGSGGGGGDGDYYSKTKTTRAVARKEDALVTGTDSPSSDDIAAGAAPASTGIARDWEQPLSLN